MPTLDAQQKLMSIANALGATGDILYMTAQGIPNRLPIGANGQVLTVSGSVPAWGAGASTSVNANAAWIQWRNAGDTADINVIRLNASNNVEISVESSQTLNLIGGNVYMQTAGTYFGVLHGLTLDADLTTLIGAQTSGLFCGAAGSGHEVLFFANGNDTNGNRFYGVKTRSTGTDANTPVQTGDQLLNIYGTGADGAAFVQGCGIQLLADGTWNGGSRPGRIDFATVASGSTSFLTRLSLGNNGDLTMNGSNGGSIVLTRASTSVAQPAATGISAAGSTITDATDLTAVYNNVTTVGASQGVQLWDAPVGTSIIVRNGGANALSVYPHGASGVINAGSAGAAVSVATTALAVFTRVSSGAGGIWIAFEAAAA